jgi:DNA-binding NarL/FixJ family response regulator
MTADRVARKSPVVVLVNDQGDRLEVARLVAEAAGRRVVTGWELPARPWDLSAAGIVVQGVLHAAADDVALVDAVVRGVGAIVGVEESRPVPVRLLDALRRSAPVLDWRPCPVMDLDATQARLLIALADGRSTRDVASTMFLSLRTAHRRMAEARDALGVPSTNAAAAEVAKSMRAWSC